MLIGEQDSLASRSFTSALFGQLAQRENGIVEPKDIREISLTGTQFIRATIAVTSKQAAEAIVAAAESGICVDLAGSSYCTDGTIIRPDTTVGADQFVDKSDQNNEGDASSDSFSSSGSSLSAGAAAGIAILVVVVVACVVLLAVRRQRSQSRAPSMAVSKSGSKSSTAYLEYLRGIKGQKQGLASAEPYDNEVDEDEMDNEMIHGIPTSYDRGCDEDAYDQGAAEDDVYSTARSNTQGYSSANGADDAGYSKADDDGADGAGYSKADEDHAGYELADEGDHPF